MIEANITLTLLVSFVVPSMPIKKYGTKNGLLVRESFKIHGIFHKLRVIYDTSMRNKSNFKVEPFLN